MSFGVFLSVGAIGAGGIAHLPSVDTDGFEFADGRRWMTAEANAAISGARAAGATAFMVADAHPGGLGLLLDELPSDVRVFRSWPRPLGQMEGIDSPGIEACLFVGHHTGAASWDGLLSRTLHAESVRDVRIDGVSQSETAIDARVAGRFGVPLVFASGDVAYTAHAEAVTANIVTVATKHAIGSTAAITRTPEWSAQAIRKAVEHAVRDRRQVAPLDPSFEQIEVEFIDRIQPELLALLPGVVRSGAHAVTLPADDILVARRWLTFVTSYLPAGLRRY